MAGPSESFNENLRLHYQYAQTPFSLSLVQKSADFRKTRHPSAATDLLPSSTRRPQNPEEIDRPPTKSYHELDNPELRRRDSLNRAQFLSSLHTPADHTYPTGRDPTSTRRHTSLQTQSTSVPSHMTPSPSSQPPMGYSWPANGPNIPLKSGRIPSSIHTKLNKDTKEPTSLRTFTPPTPPMPPSSSSSPIPAEIHQHHPSVPAQPRAVSVYEDRSEEVAKLEKQLSDVSRQAAAADANTTSLQNQLNKLQRDQQLLISSKAKLEEEKRTLSNSLTSIRKQLEAAHESVRAVQSKQQEESRKAHEAKYLQEQWDRERDQVIWERNDANSRAKKATKDLNIALSSVQRLTEERDAFRRAKEKASAERSAAISKKIELQARVAAFEKGGRVLDCPQIDALVKDRDEAKQATEAAVAELEQVKTRYSALESEKGGLVQDVWALRAELNRAEQEIQRLKQEAGRGAHELEAATKVTQAQNENDEGIQVTTPLSPVRKRAFEEDPPLHPTSSDQQSRKKPCNRDTIIINSPA